MSHDHSTSDTTTVAYLTQGTGEGSDIARKAFHATAGSSPQSTATSLGVLTLENVQQIVLFTLSLPWHLVASNHMIGSPYHLHNVHAYNDTPKTLRLPMVTLSISVVGDINPFFTNVFVSPGLASNLVGQLVDNNCNVNFSPIGCFVQDQVLWGKVIAKGPKVGKLFPFQFHSPSFSSFACSGVPHSFED
ncbi:hypothetical protein CR513_19704, partial [Mucuna pruriens]